MKSAWGGGPGPIRRPIRSAKRFWNRTTGCV